MDIRVREINAYAREMAISVPWSELEVPFEQTVNRFRRKIHLAGFRKGKVPRNIVLRHFGPEIEADFAQEAVERYYVQALEGENLTPVNRAKIADMEFSQGGPLRFTASFEVEPDVSLPRYRKKLKVNKNIYIPDEQDVENYIEELRHQSAELRPNETGSVDGSLLFVDMQELDRTGVPIVGRKVEDRYIKVGEGLFGGENVGRLTGLKPGDTTIIKIPTPDGDHLQKYQLTIKNVQEEILPELDEEFIQRVDKSASNEVELRENVMKRIQERLDRDANAQLEEAIVDFFLQSTAIEVPPSLVDNYVENSLRNAKNRDGKTLDDKRYREQIKPSAVRNLKWYLIRKALLKTEELTISDEEVDDRINGIAERAGRDSGQIRRFYRKKSNRERLRDDLLDQVLFDRLKSYAKLNEIKIPTKEIRKQRNLAATPSIKGGLL